MLLGFTQEVEQALGLLGNAGRREENVYLDIVKIIEGVKETG